MPMFHFNVRRGSVVYEDRSGVDLPDLGLAILHASEDAQSILDHEPEVSAVGQWIEVADDHGNVLRTVPFEVVAQRL